MRIKLLEKLLGSKVAKEDYQRDRELDATELKQIHDELKELSDKVEALEQPEK